MIRATEGRTPPGVRVGPDGDPFGFAPMGPIDAVGCAQPSGGLHAHRLEMRHRE